VTIKRDKLLVVDIEATCWKGDPPPGQQNEIIEIGVCLLDAHSGNLSDKRSILVRPECSIISDFCTELTTLTQKQVDSGMTFADACHLLEQDYDSRNRLWGSWGAYDRQIFAEQCKQFKIRYPFSKKHLNIKRMFADKYQQRVGMARALELAELEFLGTHHRGADDAWNIARILQHLVQVHGWEILRRYW
jgi:inhibitor of KinA sporulation pathway (predicted exonuclease)